MRSMQEQKKYQTKYHFMEQRSPEWLNIRKNRITASNAHILLAKDKTLKNYISKMIAGLNGITPNEWMLRGIELEPIAKKRYEIETSSIIEEVGFITYGDYAGCSPDGLIKGQKKGIEIKCPKDETFEKVLKENYLDKRYYAQIQMNLLITGYDSWDYVVYTDSSKFSKDIIIINVKPDFDMFKKLNKGIEKSEKYIKELLWLQ